MKKSIKLLSLLLTVVLLCVSLASCNNARNENNSTEGLTEIPTQAEIEHTEHIGAGKCEVCGIDYYETVVDYIKEKGVQDGKRYILSYPKDDDLYEIDVIDSDGIRILKHTEDSRYTVLLILSKSGIKYGEYGWSCRYVGPNGNGSGSVQGQWFPNTISPDAAIYLEKSTSSLEESTTQSAISHANTYARILINEIFMPFLEEVGHDLTPSDFGFVRFED